MTRHHAASFSNLLQSLTSFERGVTGEPPFDGLQPVILFLLTWFADFSVFGWRILFKNQANQHANVNVCKWKAPKTTLILENYTSDFWNIYVLTLKQCCLTCETQVFDSSNNIVSPPQTILFRPWKSNLRKRKCKKCRFRSLEGEWCQQIGRFHSARYNLRPVSGGRDYDPTDFPEEHFPRRTGDKVYFANRSRMPRNPRNCIWMRGKALWRPSFDKMSKAPGAGMVRQCKGRATGPAPFSPGRNLHFPKGKRLSAQEISRYLQPENIKSRYKDEDWR